MSDPLILESNPPVLTSNSPPMTNNSPYLTPTNNVQDPHIRIQNLLSTISTILASYSNSPNPPSAYLQPLFEFYERAVSLSSYPSPAQSPHSPLVSPGSGQIDNISFSQALLQSHPPDISPKEPINTRNSNASPRLRRRRNTNLTLTNINEIPLILNNLPTPSSKEIDQQKLLKEIENLEKDWWNSEIAAAWYGPCPTNPNFIRRISDNSIEYHSSSPQSSRKITIKDQPPFLKDDFAEDDKGDGDEKKQKRNSSYTLISQHRKKSQRNEWLEPLLKRDASYDGLNDE